jgi:hypothetical protein
MRLIMARPPDSSSVAPSVLAFVDIRFSYRMSHSKSNLGSCRTFRSDPSEIEQRSIAVSLCVSFPRSAGRHSTVEPRDHDSKHAWPVDPVWRRATTASGQRLDPDVGDGPAPSRSLDQALEFSSVPVDDSDRADRVYRVHCECRPVQWCRPCPIVVGRDRFHFFGLAHQRTREPVRTAAGRGGCRAWSRSRLS